MRSKKRKYIYIKKIPTKMIHKKPHYTHMGYMLNKDSNGQSRSQRICDHKLCGNMLNSSLKLVNLLSNKHKFCVKSFDRFVVLLLREKHTTSKLSQYMVRDLEILSTMSSLVIKFFNQIAWHVASQHTIYSASLLK